MYAAPDGTTFLLKALGQGRDLRQPPDRQSYLRDLSEYIVAHTSEMERGELIKRAAVYLGVAESLLRVELAGMHPAGRSGDPRPVRRMVQTGAITQGLTDPAQRHQALILRFMCQSHEIAAHVTEHLIPSDFHHGEYRPLADLLFELVSAGREVNQTHLFDLLAERGIHRVYESIVEWLPFELKGHRLADEDEPPHMTLTVPEAKVEVEGSILQIRILSLKRRVQEMQREITRLFEGGRQEEAFTRMEERRLLAQQLRELAAARRVGMQEEDAPF